MLLRIAEDVRRCLERAAEARERAQSQLNPERKADFLEMERRWLHLTESYRFVAQLEDFIFEGEQQMRQSLLRRVGALEGQRQAAQGSQGLK